MNSNGVLRLLAGSGIMLLAAAYWALTSQALPAYAGAVPAASLCFVLLATGAGNLLAAYNESRRHPEASIFPNRGA